MGRRGGGEAVSKSGRGQMCQEEAKEDTPTDQSAQGERIFYTVSGRQGEHLLRLEASAKMAEWKSWGHFA